MMSGTLEKGLVQETMKDAKKVRLMKILKESIVAHNQRREVIVVAVLTKLKSKGDNMKY